MSCGILKSWSWVHGDLRDCIEGRADKLKYGALFEQNNDFVGWISIDETSIHYPVMQTPDNPDYYLKHGFDKAYSNYGVPTSTRAVRRGSATTSLSTVTI